MFFHLQKVVLNVHMDCKPTALKNIKSLIDKVTNDIFVNACEDCGDGILRFLGPQLKACNGDAKKAIKALGEWNAKAIWGLILDAAMVSR